MMKDTVLTARRKRRELWTMLVCYVIANGVNLYAIVTYGAPWSEILTSACYVLVFAVVLYVAWTVLRLVGYGVMRMIGKR